MELLDQYLELQKKIHDYFGYVEDWVVIPLDDARQCVWSLDKEEGFVRFAETDDILNSDGNYFENEIYTQRFLTKWVYRAEDFTMICVDTHTDGNRFLQIFDNSRERCLPNTCQSK